MTDIHELAPAYALDALDQSERAAFEAHLPSCLQCAGEVDRLRVSAAALGGLESATPPPTLKKSVMEAVERGPEHSNVVSLTERIHRYRLATIGLAGVAAVLALVVAIGLVQINSTSKRAGIVEAADVATVSLEGDGFQAKFTYSISEQAGLFVSETLPSVDADKTYELWLIDDSGPQPAGLFIPNEAGNTDVLIEGALGGRSLGLTVEPEGGSDAPTGEVILIADL